MLRTYHETSGAADRLAPIRELQWGLTPWTRQVLQDVGYLRKPEGEKVEGADNLFAITIHTPDNERIFYFYDDGNIVYMLHAYAKKTSRIPVRERAIALRVRKRLIGR